MEGPEKKMLHIPALHMSSLLHLLPAPPPSLFLLPTSPRGGRGSGGLESPGQGPRGAGFAKLTLSASPISHPPVRRPQEIISELLVVNLLLKCLTELVNQLINRSRCSRLIHTPTWQETGKAQGGTKKETRHPAPNRSVDPEHGVKFSKHLLAQKTSNQGTQKEQRGSLEF